MIKVEAVVRPEKVNQVLNALQEAGCGGFHYGNVTGQGKQQGVEVFTGRGGQLVNRAAMPKTVITTVISDDQKDAVINAIAIACKNKPRNTFDRGIDFNASI